MAEPELMAALDKWAAVLRIADLLERARHEALG